MTGLARDLTTLASLEAVHGGRRSSPRSSGPWPSAGSGPLT